jgi:hypothetical protein
VATADVNMSSLSTEYLQVPVSIIASGTTVNPTSDVVQFAFMKAGKPGSSDWHIGSWDTAPGGYLAQCLVGPGAGGTVLALGTYQIWLKIVDNPEVPVRPVGLLAIT